jgi:hypothetical protein
MARGRGFAVARAGSDWVSIPDVSCGVGSSPHLKPALPMIMIPEPSLISPEGDELHYDSLTRKFMLRPIARIGGKSEYTIAAPPLVAALHYAAGAGGSFQLLRKNRRRAEESISLLLVVDTLRVLLLLTDPSASQLVEACEGHLNLDIIASPGEIWTREDLAGLGFGPDLGSPVDGGQTR